jgi:molybdopterin-guanine dinucleotide biosynthesis protein B
MIVIGIIGWKNSGKTYFAQKIIAKLSSMGLKIASIKHAHHNFDIDHPDTDSYLHRKAGSQQIIVSSSKRWAKITELKTSPEKTLDDLINELDCPDVVVVEGFKNENHLKIEIIKDSSDETCFMFNNLKNIIALISDVEIKSFDKKQFKKNQIDEIVEYILNQKL